MQTLTIPTNTNATKSDQIKYNRYYTDNSLLVKLGIVFLYFNLLLTSLILSISLIAKIVTKIAKLGILNDTHQISRKIKRWP